jgi:hypothetical protein
VLSIPDPTPSIRQENPQTSAPSPRAAIDADKERALVALAASAKGPAREPAAASQRRRLTRSSGRGQCHARLMPSHAQIRRRCWLQPVADELAVLDDLSIVSRSLVVQIGRRIKTRSQIFHVSPDISPQVTTAPQPPRRQPPRASPKARMTAAARPIPAPRLCSAKGRLSVPRRAMQCFFPSVPNIGRASASRRNIPVHLLLSDQPEKLTLIATSPGLPRSTTPIWQDQLGVPPSEGRH